MFALPALGALFGRSRMAQYRGNNTKQRSIHGTLKEVLLPKPPLEKILCNLGNISRIIAQTGFDPSFGRL